MQTVERNIRGLMIEGVLEHVEREASDDTRQKFFTLLSPYLLDTLRDLQPKAWYPLEHLCALTEALYESHDNTESAEEAIRSCSRCVARHATAGYLRLILKILTPKLLTAKMSDFWHRYHDFGDAHADLSALDSNRIVFVSTGYDYGHLLSDGWFQVLFDALGYKDVVVRNNVPSGQVIPPDEVHHEITWR